MLLVELNLRRCQEVDLLLKKLPLKRLVVGPGCCGAWRSSKTSKTLETINGKPAAEFWKHVDGFLTHGGSRLRRVSCFHSCGGGNSSPGPAATGPHGTLCHTLQDCLTTTFSVTHLVAGSSLVISVLTRIFRQYGPLHVGQLCAALRISAPLLRTQSLFQTAVPHTKRVFLGRVDNLFHLLLFGRHLAD